MSISQRPSIHCWLLVCSCYLLPLYSHSTPLPEPQNPPDKLPANIANCAHGNIAELVRRSPVILKALGAHVFTDSDPLASNLWHTDHSSFLLPTPSQRKPATEEAFRALNSADVTATVANEILITLTPETIYKGASLLKIAPIGESGARESESAYQYEGQINATLEPLSCFDGNFLKMLPTELIAFGELVTEQQLRQKQQEFQKGQPQRSDQQQQHATDILRISINGLHRWSPQFENHIWKHLGWDEWSDFTLCSVTCGKGVQQRFRRCLLDNPMMSLNMNLNSKETDEEVDGRSVMYVEDADGVAGGDNAEDGVVVVENLIESDGKQNEVRSTDSSSNNNNIISRKNHDIINDQSNDDKSSSETTRAESEMKRKEPMMLEPTERYPVPLVATDTADVIHSHWARYSKDFRANDLEDSVDEYNDAEDEVMRIFEGEELITATTTSKTKTSSAKGSANLRSESVGNTFIYKGKKKRQQAHKTKKSPESFATLFCEGYNIEQRNCNTFECSDDVNELLKFYKKFALPDDASSTSTSSFIQQQPLASDWQTFSPILAATTESPSASPSTSAGTTTAAGNAGPTTGFAPSPTPSNMGYVKSWHSNINFTIMITLRVKNDTKTTARIFSIRNSTHNLYLEPSVDGLRLYLERDRATEMLPVKFNLHDYRWHQLAISIQNGDFISIFVDCSWTNSFVVSKHLFSLPLNADVEIGRGFNGELQQLLVLPGNQERHQCSNVRTSINEVKRYIIDTFIGDDSN